MNEFSRFEDLFCKAKTSRKYDIKLEKETIRWFEENFNACFGSTTRCDTRNMNTWHYSAGMLFFGIPEIGDYYYPIVIKMIHYKYWKLKEFKEGVVFGKKCRKKVMPITDNSHRDANLYSKANFYSNCAWDCGYLIGLTNKHLKINQ